ncbi:Conserved_hypothetical protein [Hexamita inflata]|uniref:C2H2-type domain-containing protein n=1 Tax=Hexamita inflata TaxID=28002 RepID=A0ABP1GHD7_9EUKA
MKLGRDFNPATFLEFAEDYAYLILDDNINTSQRKLLKLKLIDELLPRIYLENISLLAHECRGFTYKSIYVIHDQLHELSSESQTMLSKFDVKYLNDEQMDQALSKIKRRTEQIINTLAQTEQSIAKLYAQRLRLAQLRLSKQFLETHQLQNYHQLHEEVETKNIYELIQQRQRNELYYVQNQQKDCENNKFYQNLLSQYAKNLKAGLEKPSHFMQISPTIFVQHFNYYFARKQLESLEVKQSPIFPTIQFVGDESQVYIPVQQLPDLCDDPTKAWFYLNDPRDQYQKNIEPQPYPRLLIRGNSIQQPSCILQDKQLCDVCEENAHRYQTFEKMMERAVIFCAVHMYSNLLHQQTALNTIQTLIYSHDCGISFENKKNTSKDFIELENFIINNMNLLQECSFDTSNMNISESLKNQISQFIKENPFSIDLDEEILLQNGVQTPLQSTQINTHDKDQIIINTPSNETLYIQKCTRSRTTYEMVCLVTRYLQCLNFRVTQVYPGIKREFTSVLIFNQNLGLKNLFISLENISRLEINHQLIIDPKTITQEIYNLVCSHIKSITSRDKYTQMKIAEDNSPGDCSVCGTKYDNYKQHVNTSEHIRQFRIYMQQEQGMIEALVKHQKSFERIQAINTQFVLQAQTNAITENQSYETSCKCINQSLQAIGCSFQLDVEDLPRANSPTVKSKTFVKWSDAVYGRRMGLLESLLQQNNARTSAYKRIKNSAATLAIIGFQLGQQTHQQIEQQLSNISIEKLPSFESNLVSLELQNHPSFMFNDSGYDRLIQTAYITILIRLSMGMKPLLDNETQNEIKEEAKVYNNTQVMRFLTDMYPQVDGIKYQQQIESLLKQRNDLVQNKPQMRLDTMYLNLQKLDRELELIEIGYIPETDQIINIVRTILQIQKQQNISNSQLVREAVVSFNEGKLSIINPRLNQPIKDHFMFNQTISMSNMESRFFQSDYQLKYDMTRIKLPKFFKQNSYITTVKPVNCTDLSSSSKQILKMLQNPVAITCLKKIILCISSQFDLSLSQQLLDTTSPVKKEPVFEPVFNELRSTSAYSNRRRTLKQKTRSNSICSRQCELEKDMISMVLLEPEEWKPVQHINQVSQHEKNNGMYNYNELFNKVYDSIVVENQALNESEQYFGKSTGFVAAPIISKDVVIGNQNKMIGLSASQIQATYAAQLTVTGLPSDQVCIVTALRAAQTDAFLGASASVASVTLDGQQYSLNTADVLSCALTGLASKVKILDKSVQDRVDVQSKLVKRSIPEELLQFQTCEIEPDVDIEVVQNSKIVGATEDAMVLGIYNINHSKE